ncbi:MAG: hypothetical protein HY290_09650 [Planctomycetia bacterium]|nr:hypothetical protein [Planctomycetia bacterium]
MQNNSVVLCVVFVLRILRRCIAQVGGWFVFPRSQPGKLGLGLFSLSADLDSSRLDVVSRSLWWGCGLPNPKPVPVAVCRPIAAPPRSRWRGGPPEMLPRWDH